MKRFIAFILCASAFFAGCPDKPAPNAPENHEHHNHSSKGGHADNHVADTDHDKHSAANHAEDTHAAEETHSEETHAEEPKPEPKPMPHGDADEFRWDHLTAPKPDHELVDLANAKDPVSLEPVGDVKAEYKGYLVHFENAASKEKFEKKPIKFLNMLSLEPRVDGSVVLVDASTYQDAVTGFCPFMPESEVDPHGSVYLLHRGWKVYFCCWSGCGDKFMKNPADAYDWYGLVERDGKLMRKE